MGIFLAIIAPAVSQKFLALALAEFGLAYLIWLSHWTRRFKAVWRVVAIVVILVSIDAGAIPQLVDQWRLEHMHSELAFNATAPGIAYPEGDHLGIKWWPRFAEIRLGITSKAHFPIQNLSLSIGPADDGSDVGGMTQVGEEPPGCAALRPRSDLPYKSVILRGQDGSTADASPTINDEMSKVWPIRKHYDLLCQRILEGETVFLVVAANNHNLDKKIVIPARLHVTGSYETTPTEGSKRIPVDEFVPITRP